MGSRNEIEVVSIRLVEDPPLYSKKAIHSPDDVLDVMGEELQKYDRELFCVLNLRTKNQVINLNIVSIGTLNTSLVHPRELFKSAILANAAGVMLLHNHPSGICSPSEADLQVTKRMEEAGNLLGIPVVDHVIVGADGERYSFRENQRLTFKTIEMSVAERPAAYGKGR